MRRLASYAVALAAIVALVATGSAAPVAADEAGAARLGPKVTPFELRPSDDPRLRRAWKRWVKARTPHYVTRTSRACDTCDAAPPIRTEVRRGRLVSVRDAIDDVSKPWSEGMPMDRIYRQLRRVYNNADKVSVRYGKRGVPLHATYELQGLEWSLTVRARTHLGS